MWGTRACEGVWAGSIRECVCVVCRRVYARVCVCIPVKVCGRVSISVVCRRVYGRVCVCVCVRLLVDGCALMHTNWRESRKGSLANPLRRLPAFDAKKFIKARMTAGHATQAIVPQQRPASHCCDGGRGGGAGLLLIPYWTRSTPSVAPSHRRGD